MAFRSRVIDKDRGLKELLKKVTEAKGATVKVGVTESIGSEAKEIRKTQKSSKKATGQKGDPVTILDVAWWNEYGTKRKVDGKPKIHVPARSFIRSTTDEQRRNILRQKRDLAGKILDRTITVRAALTILGEWMQAKIQRKITRLKTPPNAASTVARKKSSNPLVDIGQLRQSIRYQVSVPREGGA